MFVPRTGLSSPHLKAPGSDTCLCFKSHAKDKQKTPHRTEGVTPPLHTLCALLLSPPIPCHSADNMR